MIYEQYRSTTKVNPKWLDLFLFWTIIPPMIIVMIVIELITGKRERNVRDVEEQQQWDGTAIDKEK